MIISKLICSNNCKSLPTGRKYIIHILCVYNNTGQQKCGRKYRFFSSYGGFIKGCGNQGVGIYEFVIRGRWLVRMRDDDCLAAVEVFHQRIQFRMFKKEFKVAPSKMMLLNRH